MILNEGSDHNMYLGTPGTARSIPMSPIPTCTFFLSIQLWPKLSIINPFKSVCTLCEEKNGFQLRLVNLNNDGLLLSISTEDCSFE